MARTRPSSAPLGLVAALALLAVPWQPAASDDHEKGPPPPEYRMVEEALIEAVPERKPSRVVAPTIAPAVESAVESEVPEIAADDALPEQLAAEVEADDLTELIDALRARMEASRRQSQLPLGNLARDLEQARLDVERLAELLLRKEIAELQQRAAQAQTEEQMAWLAQSLESAEQRLVRLLQERDAMERIAADSAARVDELALSLIEADDERRRLEESLETAETGAIETRRALAAASRRIHEINQEIASIEAASEARVRDYEARVAAAETQLREFEGELLTQQQTADALLAAREGEIQRLAERQAQAREVLVRALAEFDEVSEARDAAQEQELFRQAQVASRTRETVLADMGFRRDARGNLLPPEMALGEGDVDLAAIEPAAGPSCLADAALVARPYLDDAAAASWNHYLLGTVRFADAAASPEEADLTPIIACLDELSGNAAFYFRVIGHTDSSGAPSLNQRLSLQRAQAVRDTVAARVAVQPWRLMVQGRGPDYPVADNDTAEGQAINRRVEVFAIQTPFEQMLRGDVVPLAGLEPARP